jgi:hypothetical protein
MKRNNQYAINGPYMLARFKRVCKAMGWDCESELWTRVGDDNIATVGRVFVEKAPMHKLYRIVQIATDSGGERHLSDSGMTGKELDAWFAGILLAREGERA